MENAEMTSHIAEIKLLQINFIRDLMCDLQHILNKKRKVY